MAPALEAIEGGAETGAAELVSAARDEHVAAGEGDDAGIIARAGKQRSGRERAGIDVDVRAGEVGGPAASSAVVLGAAGGPRRAAGEDHPAAPVLDRERAHLGGEA